jgi:hypothetical protein
MECLTNIIIVNGPVQIIVLYISSRDECEPMHDRIRRGSLLLARAKRPPPHTGSQQGSLAWIPLSHTCERSNASAMRTLNPRQGQQDPDLCTRQSRDYV